MRKWRAIVGLILDLLIVAGVGYALSNMYFGYFVPAGSTFGAVGDIFTMMQYFTNWSNLFLALVAILSIIANILVLAGKKPAKGVAVLKLMAVAATSLTLVIVTAYLVPFAPGGTWALLFDLPYCLVLHLVAPLLAIISFIIANKPRLKWAYSFLGLVPMVAYGAPIFVLIFLKMIKPPYDFLTIFDAAGNFQWTFVWWSIGAFVGIFLLALLLNGLRNIGAAELPAAKETAEAEEEARIPFATKQSVSEDEEPIVIEDDEESAEPAEEEPAEPEEEPEEKPVSYGKGETSQDEEPASVTRRIPISRSEPKPEPEPKPAPKPQPKPRVAPTSAPVASKPALKPAASRPVARTYHISRQPDTHKWQVKLAGSTKVIRVLDTQAEAIAFTKGLVESRGGSYRIHSVKGRIRK